MHEIRKSLFSPIQSLVPMLHPSEVTQTPPSLIFVSKYESWGEWRRANQGFLSQINKRFFDQPCPTYFPRLSNVHTVHSHVYLVTITLWLIFATSVTYCPRGGKIFIKIAIFIWAFPIPRLLRIILVCRQSATPRGERYPN